MRNIVYFIILLLVAAGHFLATFVVTLFLLSTLNILNADILHITRIKYAEVTVTAFIFIVSVYVYVRSFRKISLFIKHVILKEPLP